MPNLALKLILLLNDNNHSLLQVKQLFLIEKDTRGYLLPKYEMLLESVFNPLLLPCLLLAMLQCQVSQHHEEHSSFPTESFWGLAVGFGWRGSAFIC